MDAALYLSLRDEMQQDAARVERQLEELRRAESFLLRRIHSTRHLASYKSVLNDLSSEISHSEADHAELLHLSRFVTGALVKAYASESPAAKSQSIDQSPTASVSLNPPGRPEATLSPPATPNPEKSNGSIVDPNHLSQTPATAEPVTVLPRKRGDLQFDEAGFPIVAIATKSSPAIEDTIPPLEFAKAPEEPPTVVFDQQGFPLNAPTDDSMNTLLELPNSQSGHEPLSNKDK